MRRAYEGMCAVNVVRVRLDAMVCMFCGEYGLLCTDGVREVWWREICVG